VGRWTATIKRAPFVFEVRDLWPDAILQSGVGKEGSLFAKTLDGISRYLYRSAVLNVVVTKAFSSVLQKDYGIESSKIAVIENGVDIEPFVDPSPLEDRWGIGDRFVVSFMGTIGLAHGLGTVLRAAEILRDKKPDTVFVIAGEGAELEKLRAAAESTGSNVIFTGGLGRSEVFSFLGRSDIALVLLKDAPVFRTVLPTKLLEAMAAGLPVILGVQGQALEILEAADCGVAITPEDADQLAEAVIRLKSDPHLRERLGGSGRRYIQENLTRSASSKRYIEELETITGLRR
jgi:glycosyltransferase involved in cell wall biosynthesis